MKKKNIPAIFLPSNTELQISDKDGNPINFSFEKNCVFEAIESSDKIKPKDLSVKVTFTTDQKQLKKLFENVTYSNLSLFVMIKVKIRNLFYRIKIKLGV